MTNHTVKTIIICCPGNALTGGINSLHNLCKALTENNYNAYMYYVNANETILNDYQITSYQVNRIHQINDSADTLVVVPETMVPLVLQLQNAKKVVYWLGLNYFFKKPTWRFPFNLKLIRKLISCRSCDGYSSGYFETAKRRLNDFSKSHLNMWNGDIIHLSNSHFVANYCRKKGSPYTYVLHNPIRQEFYAHQPNFKNREKIILFGPRTPKYIIRRMRKHLPEFSIIRVRKIPFEQVTELMSKAVIFAEFGNYSGRDRMPREAAMLGCNIFMNTRGTAAFEEDYNIPREYTIPDSPGNIKHILQQLTNCALNYQEHIVNFEEFRNQLSEEKKNFTNNTKEIFNQIITDGYKDSDHTF